MKHLIYLLLLFCSCKPRPIEPLLDDQLKFFQDQGTFPNSTVFTGSSTIEYWKDLPVLFSDYSAINRGVAGRSIDYIAQYSQVLIYMHTPKTVVLYIGDNDVYYFSVQKFIEYFESWRGELFSRLPEVDLVLISLKPSPDRTAKYEEYRQINAYYEQLAAQSDKIYYVNIWDPMIANPWPYFLTDRIHLNGAGYDLLAERLRPVLEQLEE